MKQDIIDKLEKISSNPHADEKQILYQLKGLIYEADLQNPFARPSNSIAELVANNINRLKNGKQIENLIRTGFNDFDALFGGFALGELVVIGGRPGMGKTQLLVNLALQMVEKEPILYFSFDLSTYLLTSRFLAAATNIANNKILQQQLNEAEMKLLTAQNSKFSNMPLYINDSCNNSVSAFKAYCLKHIEEHGVKIIIVDYIQMMTSNRNRYNRELEISYISRELKNIAKDYNICVIAPSQLSRAVESRGGFSKYPQLSDLRESGAIEQDADKVIFIYRPEYYGITHDDNGNNIEGLTELILAKNRNGKTGTIKLQHNANFTNYKSFEGFVNDFTFSKTRMNEINDSELF